MKRYPRRLDRRLTLVAGVSLAAGLFVAQAAAANSYQQTNLVTDDQAFLKSQGFAAAVSVDRNLINPWGLASSATGPWWSANQGSGTSTIYTASGGVKPTVVTVPQKVGATGAVGVTGVVAAAGGGFVFSNLDGSISTWKNGVVTTPVGPTLQFGPGHPALYTGLASSVANGQSTYYAPNQVTHAVDMYDSSFHLVSGGFIDPKGTLDAQGNLLTAFNAQNIDGQIWVTYAAPGPASAHQALGEGLVDVFNADGSFVRRFASGGQLDSPWGIVRAPDDFGQFAGDILVGNFNSDGFGTINAFDYDTGAFKGTLQQNGQDLVLPGLWALAFGKGSANNGATDTLFFAAGIGNEKHGLFGSIAAVPEPSTWAMMIGGFGLLGARLRRSRRAAILAL